MGKKQGMELRQGEKNMAEKSFASIFFSLFLELLFKTKEIRCKDEHNLTELRLQIFSVVWEFFETFR